MCTPARKNNTRLKKNFVGAKKTHYRRASLSVECCLTQRERNDFLQHSLAGKKRGKMLGTATLHPAHSRTLMQSSLQVETDKHFFAAKGEGFDAIMHSQHLEHFRQHNLNVLRCYPIPSNAESCLQRQIGTIELGSQAAFAE